jgi:hypothetical protein
MGFRPRRGKNLRVVIDGDPIRIPLPSRFRIPRIAFGLVPLTTPYDETDPEVRVLNAVARGLVFEGTTSIHEELQISKPEYNRVLRSLRDSGLVFVDPSGKYQLTVNTSNFPNLVVHKENS